MKRFFKFIGFFVLAILLLVGIALWLLTKEKYQNLIAQKATAYLSEKIGTKVNIDHVKISVFNEVSLKGVFIEDKQKDTLAYVGSLNVKTSELLSNWWNEETSVIKTVSLDDVFVNLNRTDTFSNWNYNFLVDAFSSKQSIDTTIILPEKKESKSNSPRIDLKDIALNRVRFIMNDGWRGEDMRFSFNKVNLGIDQFELEKKRINIKELAIHEADALVREYKGGKPKDLTPDDTTTWGTPFNPDKFNVTLANFNISKTSFRFEDGNSIPKPHEFDAKHLGFNDIEIHLNNTEIKDDTLYTHINKFSAKERCGLEIKSLTANAKISQVQSYLTNMLLETPNSSLKHHYEMNYKNFHDFNDYIAKVNMKAHLSNSSISSIDIAYFANLLNQYPISINVAGDVDGTVEKLQARNLMLSTLSTSFKGDALVMGLPDIEKTVFEVSAKELKTNGRDLNKLIPQTKVDAVAWHDLQMINFKGTYKGKVDEFNVKGNLNTNLGNSIVDLNMNFKEKIPFYSGELETQKFNLGRLLKQKTLGTLSMKGKIDGRGFDMDDLDAKVNAFVSQIEVDGNSYSNLTINGLVAKKKFDGIFVSQDPNLALNFDGKLDLSGKQPKYDFNSRFIKFDLQKLGITKERMIGSGYASLNFTGDNIDNFIGEAVLKNVSLETGGRNFFADNISLSSTYDLGKKKLVLESSIADAELMGNFNVSNLPNAFQIYLYHYLPQYIKKPANVSTQAFSYTVKLKEIAPLLNTFASDVSGLENSMLSGELNTNKQLFSLDVLVPQVGFKEFQIDSLQIVGAGDFNSFDLNAVSRNFYYNESVIMPSMQINSSMANDTANLTINTQSINSLLGEASINCRATAMNSNLYVNVLPSNININSLTWNFSAEKELIFGKQIDIKDFVVESGPQKIILSTQQGITSDLLATVENIDLENISQIVSSDGPQFLGHINGNIEVRDFQNNPLVHANLLSSDVIRIDKDTVGMVTAKVDYDVKNNLLTIDKSTSLTNYDSYANVEGSVNAKDSTIDVKTSLSRLNIGFLNQFLSEYIQNMRGLASGQVLVKGNLNNPSISGSVDLAGASLKVLFLGTTYAIDNAKFRFNNRRIEMDNIIIRDERQGNYTGLVKGYISHNNFSDFYLNFNVNSSNLLCLNTQDAADQLFYGYIPAAISAKLTGELNDVDVDIDAKPLKGSQFHLPISSSGDASNYEFIKFASLGRNQIEEIKVKKDPSYVNLRMKIEATPDIETFIILDRNTGEEIVAKGNGAIILNVDLGNSVEMFGSYAITEGIYKFNFRGLFPKEFTIGEDSRINWTGDALAANMNVKAIYKLPNPLPLYPLVSEQMEKSGETGPDLDEAKKPYTTFVELKLAGSLSTPDIKFDISQPDNKASGTTAFNRLEQIRNDEKELVSQAGILLLLGTFKADAGVSQSTYSSGAISSMSDLITSAVSSEITNQFQNITGLKGINLNIDHRTLNNGLSNDIGNREKFTFNVSANLWKDRILVDVGNSVDLGRNSSGSTNSNLIVGDFKAYYVITKDGRLRVNAYRTQNSDIEGVNSSRNGLGLSYKKVFNNFSELFQLTKKKVKTTDTLPTNS